MTISKGDDCDYGGCGSGCSAGDGEDDDGDDDANGIYNGAGNDHDDANSKCHDGSVVDNGGGNESFKNMWW